MGSGPMARPPPMAMSRMKGLTPSGATNGRRRKTIPDLASAAARPAPRADRFPAPGARGPAPPRAGAGGPLARRQTHPARHPADAARPHHRVRGMGLAAAPGPARPARQMAPVGGRRDGHCPPAALRRPGGVRAALHRPAAAQVSGGVPGRQRPDRAGGPAVPHRQGGGDCARGAAVPAHPAGPHADRLVRARLRHRHAVEGRPRRHGAQLAGVAGGACLEGARPPRRPPPVVADAAGPAAVAATPGDRRPRRTCPDQHVTRAARQRIDAYFAR